MGWQLKGLWVWWKRMEVLEVEGKKEWWETILLLSFYDGLKVECQAEDWEKKKSMT